MRRYGIIGRFPGARAANAVSTQEFNFRYIAEVIVDLDYDGYVNHERRPTPSRDLLRSIEKEMAIVNVYQGD